MRCKGPCYGLFFMDYYALSQFWNQIPCKGVRLSPAILALALLMGPARSACLGQTTNSEPIKLKQTEVFGSPLGYHDVASETELVGPANQPEWTTRRVFSETDVYVIPPGEIEFNQFYISSHDRHGKPENLFESELEMGLPWRTQFDVEMNYGVEDGDLAYDSTMIEMPHALAEWGKIPFNPAINAGWRFRTDEPDSYLFRLLLAEQFGDRLYFGANLSFERQVSGELETTYELNSALNYRLIDQKLSVGTQLVVEYETARESEFDAEDAVWETESEYETEVLLGPTVLYRPTSRIHLGLAPLFGLTSDSPVVEAYFLVGIDFEPFRGSASKEQDSEGGWFPSLRRPR